MSAHFLPSQAICGRNSGVECQLPKLDVAGSNPVARSLSLLPRPEEPMRSPAVATVCSLLAAPLLAQNQWVPPQPPCDIAPGFFRINSAVVDLKGASEQPR